MVTDRWLTAGDRSLLALSLAQDEHHAETPPEFFYTPGTIAKVYEDESGPICFVRGAKALRLDIQYVDNSDKKRNLTAMLEFERLANEARTNGFTEVCFTTNSPLLRKFCERRFGFERVNGDEMRLFL